MRVRRPGSEFLIHPECGRTTQDMEYVAAGDIVDGGVHMVGASGMLKRVRAHSGAEFIAAATPG